MALRSSRRSSAILAGPLRPTSRLSLATGAALLLTVWGGSSATAALSVWNGDAATGAAGDNITWANANNWTTGGAVDVAPASTDDLSFGTGLAGGTIDLGGNRVGNSIAFTRNYSLGLVNTGNTLTNTTGTFTIATNVTGTINAVLAGTSALNLSGGGTLLLNRAIGNTFTGAINVDGAGTTLAFVGTGTSADQTALGAGTKAITLTNGGAISVVTASANPTGGTKSVVIGATGGTINVGPAFTFTLDDGGQFSGTGNLTKNGDGILLLSNQAFAYTGSTVNVTGGTLRVSANTGVLGTGAVNINISAGGTYDNLIGLAGTKNITVAGLGFNNGGAIIASSGNTSSIPGTVTMVNDTSIGGGGQLNISGVISNGANGYTLYKVGGGVTALSGANTYDGVTLVQGGVLRAADGVGLPAVSNLDLEGGVFEPTTASFTRAIGFAGGQVQVNAGDTGFSSQVAGTVVNLGGSGATLLYGSNGFNPTNFVLNASSAINPITLQNGLDLQGDPHNIAVNVTTNAGANTATIAGVISDSTGVTNTGINKVGPGVLILGATNTYLGATTITAGSLRGTLGTNIPGNLVLAGGAYESGTNITVLLGTGKGQVQFLSGGGFSAFGAPITVNLGGAAAPLKFGGTPSFATTNLLLNQSTANNTIEFLNPLDLNGAARTVTVNGNVATISSVVSDSSNGLGILTKAGNGVLILSNPGNNYTGATTVTAGGLRVTDGIGLPTASNLTLNGGNLETGVTFTRALGTAANQVQLLNGGNSGFSAIGAPTAINLGGAGATVLWGSATFNPVNLILNGGAATATLDFRNGIDLNGASRIVQSNSTNVATISGVISNSSTTSAGFTFNGTGVLALAGTNTYNGGTTLNSGTVVIDRDANLGAATGGLTFGVTSTPTLRYTGTGETISRAITLAGTTVGANIEMAGTGNLRFTGNVTSTGAGIKTLNLLGSTTGIGELAGVINNQSTTNVTSLTKNGTGTWRLSGANTFTGGVTITTGNLIVSNSGALGTGTKTIGVFQGNPGDPKLMLEGNITLPSTFTYNTSANQTPTSGAFVNLSGNNTVGGIIKLNGGGGDTGLVSQSGKLTITASVEQFTTGLGVRNLRLRGPGDGELSGVISNGTFGGTNGIIQEGTGTWSVSAANTFSASSSVISGRLLATNSTGSAFGTAPLTVSGTGTLGGTGSFTGSLAVNAGGTINPGVSVGTLSVGSAVTLAGTSLTPAGRATLAIDLQPSVTATQNDRLSLTGAGAAGALSLSTGFDTLNLIPVELVGSSLLTLTIATFSSVTGIFDSVLVNGLGSQNTDPLAGNYVNVIYNTNNIQVQVANLTAVPEPATLGLLLAVGPLFFSRRRRA